MNLPKIIYQDFDLCIVEKPFGMESEHEMCLWLKRILGCGVYPVHRLDRDAGGVMVYALNKEPAAKLCAQIADGGFEKIYLAVLIGKLKNKSGTLEDYLYHDRSKNKSYVVNKSRRGVKKAELDYELISSVDLSGTRLSLVMVRLHTGRTHQIRVQFASRGLPLLGDKRYGGRLNGLADCTGLCLWSNRLSFVHPKTGVRVEICSLPPSYFPWTQFNTDL